MQLIRTGVSKFFRDIEQLFRGRNVIWHGIAIALTWFLVVSGFDWWVATTARTVALPSFIRQAGFIGFFLPVAAPLIALAIGALRHNRKLIMTGLLIAQAEITGLLLSFFYKALTGRPGPHGFGISMGTGLVDTSTVFQFGFLRGGVFWGWPSSHIIVSISAVVLLMVLYKHNALVKYLALAYGVYMAVSVSLTFHWFSDGLAAVIFGILVGRTVAGSFQRR